MANSTERRFTAALWALRTTTVFAAVVAVLQPVWIGQYMSGVFSMIGLHGSLGSGLAALQLLVGISALLYAIAGGRLMVVLVASVLFLATGLQIGVGYSGALWLHIPLGVLIVVGAVLLSIWTWTAGAKRRRPIRGRRSTAATAASTSEAGPATGDGSV